MTPKYTAIIDQIGRTIIGVVVSESNDTITLNNPVILHCQPEASGQLQVQTFPLFFFEFIKKDAREYNDWTYTRANIITSNVELDEKIIAHYEKLNTPQPAVPNTITPNVISINDID